MEPHAQHVGVSAWSGPSCEWSGGHLSYRVWFISLGMMFPSSIELSHISKFHSFSRLYDIPLCEFTARWPLEGPWYLLLGCSLRLGLRPLWVVQRPGLPAALHPKDLADFHIVGPLWLCAHKLQDALRDHRAWVTGRRPRASHSLLLKNADKMLTDPEYKSICTYTAGPRVTLVSVAMGTVEALLC